MWKCEKCGGTDVAAEMLVKVNDVQQTDFATEPINDTDAYCYTCDAYVGINYCEED